MNQSHYNKICFIYFLLMQAGRFSSSMSLKKSERIEPCRKCRDISQAFFITERAGYVGQGLLAGVVLKEKQKNSNSLPMRIVNIPRRE